ncbi:MAG: hypothetical protein ABH803_03000 [Candidatus Micrarchaeota archaeon]
MLKQVLFFALLLTLIAASPISLTSEKTEVEMCLWDTIPIALNVKNTGTQTDSVELSVNGPEFVSILPKKLSIQPGKEEQAFAYISPSCFSKTGSYTIQITGKSSTDSKKTTINLKVKECISITASEQDVCLGEKKDLPIIFKNNALTSENTYKIESSLPGLPSEIKLKAGEEKTISIQIDSKKYKLGENAFRIKATALYVQTGEETEDSTTINPSINIKSCTNALIEIQSEKQTCTETETNYPVVITNAGKAGTYTLSLTGLPFGKIMPATLALSEGETKQVNLAVSSGLKPEKYSFKIQLKNNDFVFEEEKEINYKNCFEVTLSGKSDFVCQCQEKGFTIDAINTGSHEDSFYVNYHEGPDWVKPTFDVTPFELKGGTKKTLSYSVFDCNAQPGDYTLIFKINSVNGKSGDLLGQELTVKPREECYSAEIKTKKEYALPGETTELEITIKNSGLVENTYSLSVQGANWASFKQEFITIPAGSIKKVILEVTPSKELNGKTTNLVLKATSKDVETTQNIELIAGAKPMVQATATTEPEESAAPSQITGAFIEGNTPLVLALLAVLVLGLYFFLKKTDKK